MKTLFDECYADAVEICTYFGVAFMAFRKDDSTRPYVLVADLHAVGNVLIRDMPLVVLKQRGVRLSDKMIAIVDKFVEYDPSDINQTVTLVREAAKDLSSIKDSRS